MKFSIALPTDRVDQPDEFVTGEAVAEVAATVERSGLDACFVTDHPAPDTKWLDGGGHHALEPTVALSFAAAATRTTLVHTHIYVLAYRNPFLAAKALASLDVLSGGRAVIGIGPGYLRAEFAALGIDFDSRVAATDATVDLLRRLWAGEVVAGEDMVETPSAWSARGVLQLPTPARQPTLWFGGNSRRSMERAISVGQGWSPFPTSPQLAGTARTASISNLDELQTKMIEFHIRCEEVGARRADRRLFRCVLAAGLPERPICRPAVDRRARHDVRPRRHLDRCGVPGPRPGGAHRSSGAFRRRDRQAAQRLSSPGRWAPSQIRG